MQFFILLLGVFIFIFYQFNTAPLSFNDSLLKEVQSSKYHDSLRVMQSGYDSISNARQQLVSAYTIKLNNRDNSSDSIIKQIKRLNEQSELYRSGFRTLASRASKKETNDTNYVFLSFVKNHLPDGLKGLLIAIIFLAAWGSIAAALNSLAASTVVDFHQRIHPTEDINQYRIAKWYTFGWGVFSIFIAQFSTRLGQSLIEAVNVLGSLFYGVILGIFLIAFYVKYIKGTATFISAIIIEIMVVLLFFDDRIPFLHNMPHISFLWLNAIGAIGVVLLGYIMQLAANALHSR